jgi:hypothetical protein
VDPFHVIKLATDALDQIRREVWNQARREGHAHEAKAIKGSRFALWMNPAKLSDKQQAKLAHIQQTNKPLYRAYLIAQQLRSIYRVSYEQAIQLLDAWLAWARRCRLAPFVKLARTITEQRPGIEAAIQHGLSNHVREKDAEEAQRVPNPFHERHLRAGRQGSVTLPSRRRHRFQSGLRCRPRGRPNLYTFEPHDLEGCRTQHRQVSGADRWRRQISTDRSGGRRVEGDRPFALLYGWRATDLPTR